MLKTIISFILSFIVGSSGISLFPASGFADEISEMLFGIPCTEDAIEDSFLSDFDLSDIRLCDENLGFIKNRIVLLMNPDAGLLKKRAFFISHGLKAIGWCAVSDLYVATCNALFTGDIIALCEELKEYDEVVYALPLTVTKNEETYTPNDPFNFKNESVKPVWNETRPYGSNWWLEAVNARFAWDYSDLFKKVKLGIVDGGFQTDHEDLKGKIKFPDSIRQSRNVPADHGCHVAGIMSANINNGKGVAGICPKAELYCVDWSMEDNQLWSETLAIIFGLAHNVKAGAKAVNFSVGMSGSIPENYAYLNNSSFRFSALLSSYVMASLLSKGYEFVVCHSAGNGNSALQCIDARNSGYFAAISKDNCFTGLYKVSADDIINRIIVVGSAQNMGSGKYMQAPSSNSGPEVSIAAPGVYVYSCVSGDGYEYFSGTSMATPIVAGIAGLIWGVNPDFTGAQVKKIICSCTRSKALASTGAVYLGDYELRDLPMADALLCVEQALRQTYKNYGTVRGTVTSDSEITEARFGGRKYTVCDGRFSITAPKGSGEIVFADENGNTVYTATISVTAGKITDAAFEVPVPRADEPEPETTGSDTPAPDTSPEPEQDSPEAPGEQGENPGAENPQGGETP